MMKISFLLLFFLLLPVAPLSATALSTEDMQVIEILKKHNVFPPNYNIAEVPSEILQKSLTYWKYFIDKGVLDINSLNQVKDSKYLSPEKTWELYRSSLIKGDIKSAIKCLEPQEALNFIEIYQDIGKEKFKQIGKNLASIEKITQDEHIAHYRLYRMQDGQKITYYIYFLNINGNWKIEKL